MHRQVPGTGYCAAVSSSGYVLGTAESGWSRLVTVHAPGTLNRREIVMYCDAPTSAGTRDRGELALYGNCVPHTPRG